MGSEEFFTEQREQMVRRQIARRGIKDAAILRAMRAVPREAFVPAAHSHAAYKDTPLPIPASQTISQPYVVALMLNALDLEAEDRALEVGSGSGYAAALLGQIVREVHAVERHKELVAYARTRLDELGYANVHVHHSDGTTGWPPAAPYDAIMVSASGPDVPASLREQLAVGGRLIMPVGGARDLQTLLLVQRLPDAPDGPRYRQKDLGGVRFVPLIGEEGW
ncbi:MAG: protein-L-isoaspartate(D-aspartate) O-methyltransferase [Candidatus Promineifilaceae bacterium]|nr:protein-L-isoaspartate(D-aspartate) O-methyltransferase [Candidatus Promineifilaceae bacterium]